MHYDYPDLKQTLAKHNILLADKVIFTNGEIKSSSIETYINQDFITSLIVEDTYENLAHTCLIGKIQGKYFWIEPFKSGIPNFSQIAYEWFLNSVKEDIVIIPQNQIRYSGSQDCENYVQASIAQIISNLDNEQPWDKGLREINLSPIKQQSETLKPPSMSELLADIASRDAKFNFTVPPNMESTAAYFPETDSAYEHVANLPAVINFKAKLEEFMSLCALNLLLKNYDINDPLVAYLQDYSFHSDMLNQETMNLCACIVSTIKTMWPESTHFITFNSDASHEEIEAGISQFFQTFNLTQINQQIIEILTNIHPSLVQFWQQLASLFSIQPPASISRVEEQLKNPEIKGKTRKNLKKKRQLHNMRDTALEDATTASKNLGDFLLQEKRKEHKRDFNNFAEVHNHEGRIRVEKFCKAILTSPEPLSIKLIQEKLLRESLTSSFADTIKEDICNNKTVSDSPILKLFDLMINDFINPNQEAIWLFEGLHNFGYHYSSEAIINKVFDEKEIAPCLASIIVNNLDALADEIANLQIENLSAGEYFQIIRNEKDQEKFYYLYKLWQIQFDKASKNKPDSLFGSSEEYNEDAKPNIGTKLALSWYFEYFLIEQFLKENPVSPLVDHIQECLNNETDVIYPFHILQLIYSIEEIQAKLSALLKTFNEFIKKIINSRSQDDKTFQATLGMGFSGNLFDRSAQGMEGKVFLTFSSKYTEHYHHLLLKLLKDTLDNNPELHENISFIIPTLQEENSLVHKYIALRILDKVYNHPDQSHPDMLNSWRNVLAKNCLNEIGSIKNKIKSLAQEIQSLKSNIAKIDKELIDLRKTKPTEKITQRITSLEKGKDSALIQIEEKAEKQACLKNNIANLEEIVTAKDNLQQTISTRAFALLEQLFNEQKRSLCIEALISPKSNSNLYIPISFRNHQETLQKDGEPITIGKCRRRVIPPCNDLCQLFAPAHLLWATLLDRKLSLNQLHEQALRQGKSGFPARFTQSGLQQFSIFSPPAPAASGNELHPSYQP